MDRREWSKRQTALRARADEAIMAAVAAVDARAPSLGIAVANAMEAIGAVCWDFGLAPGDRLSLIDDALRMLPLLKGLARAAQAARPAMIVEIYRRTDDLLSRYARFIRASAD
jgi:hypothetical protein